MVNLANDTLKELIDILKMIDYPRISPDRQKEFIAQLDLFAGKYLPKRKNGMVTKSFDIPGCPQKLADVINSFDLSKYQGSGLGKAMQRAGFKTILVNYLRKTIPMK